MATYAFFQEDLNDIVKEFNGVAVITSDTVTNYPIVDSNFFIAADADDIEDLCVNYEGTVAPTITLQRAIAGTLYNLTGDLFNGPRPNGRPF